MTSGTTHKMYSRASAGFFLNRTHNSETTRFYGIHEINKHEKDSFLSPVTTHFYSIRIS